MTAERRKAAAISVAPEGVRVWVSFKTLFGTAVVEAGEIVAFEEENRPSGGEVKCSLVLRGGGVVSHVYGTAELLHGQVKRRLAEAAKQIREGL